MAKILLLEDDISLIDGLVFTLEKNEYQVKNVKTVADALACLEQETFSLLILDVSLPDGSGFSVCKKVRETSKVPIIFLTAADEEFSIVQGLDLGGDDYITKPFKLGELLSRIRALLRRAGKNDDEAVLCAGDIVVQLSESRVTVLKQRIELTAAEYKLLCLFLKNQGKTLTRQSILTIMWDEGGEFVDDNTLSVYVRRLREKIEKDPSKPEYLHTVRGFGYRFFKEENRG